MENNKCYDVKEVLIELSKIQNKLSDLRLIIHEKKLNGKPLAWASAMILSELENTLLEDEDQVLNLTAENEELKKQIIQLKKKLNDNPVWR
jgi:hypothetical protein